MMDCTICATKVSRREAASARWRCSKRVGSSQKPRRKHTVHRSCRSFAIFGREAMTWNRVSLQSLHRFRTASRVTQTPTIHQRRARLLSERRSDLLTGLESGVDSRRGTHPCDTPVYLPPGSPSTFPPIRLSGDPRFTAQPSPGDRHQPCGSFPLPRCGSDRDAARCPPSRSLPKWQALSGRLPNGTAPKGRISGKPCGLPASWAYENGPASLRGIGRVAYRSWSLAIPTPSTKGGNRMSPAYS